MILCEKVAGSPVVGVHTPCVCVPHEVASLWRVCGFTRGGLGMGFL